MVNTIPYIDFVEIDEQAIIREIDAGYISEQRDESGWLRILNYTARCQFDWR